jgi:iron complex transport system substrate-binding protein
MTHQHGPAERQPGRRQKGEQAKKRSRTQNILGAAVLLLTLAMHGSYSRADVVLRDAAGRPVAATDASRIVAVGGSITEILYAIGREDRVVAVDSTSAYPPAALKDKPNVGYMRALSPEGVLGLNPSLVLALEGSGPPQTIAVLQAASVPFVVVPDRFTGDGMIEKIHTVALAAGAPTRGDCLAKVVQSDLDALASLRKGIAKPVRVVFVLSIANGRPMVAGRNTAAEGIIGLAGAVNAIEGYDGYKQVSDEAVVAAKPDVVLVMNRDSHPISADEVFAHPAFALTPAGERKAFVAMGALYLLGFGPRTARAARDLSVALYPVLGRDTLPSDKGDAIASCTK